jgi:hypothetical protein
VVFCGVRFLWIAQCAGIEKRKRGPCTFGTACCYAKNTNNIEMMILKRPSPGKIPVSACPWEVLALFHVKPERVMPSDQGSPPGCDLCAGGFPGPKPLAAFSQGRLEKSGASYAENRTG